MFDSVTRVSIISKHSSCHLLSTVVYIYLIAFPLKVAITSVVRLPMAEEYLIYNVPVIYDRQAAG